MQGENINNQPHFNGTPSTSTLELKPVTIIEPSQAVEQNKKPLNKRKIDWLHWILITILIILLGLGGWLYFYVYSNRGEFSEMPLGYNKLELNKNFTAPARSESLVKSIANLDSGIEAQAEQFRRLNAGFVEVRPAVNPGLYKTFSGNDFRDLFDNFKYPDTQPIGEKPFIRNNPQVDQKIQTIAEGRGYKLRPQADESKLVSAGRERLHPTALKAWQELQTAARAEGYTLILTSGYRSVADQRGIFVNAISGLTNEQIVSGQADSRINSVLITRSIPGYSRHHTGYTIDIACSDGQITNFKNTPCYQWMSAYNYLNAKRFGFIPSYPAGAENQGPEPEEWEYVWVGENTLRR